MFDVTAKYDWTLKPSEGSLMGSEISLVEAISPNHFVTLEKRRSDNHELLIRPY